MNNQIHPIHTACKQCVFAKYDGITQIDCSLSYIDKYKQSGVEILEAYDNEKEFYIVNNKKCIGYRENKWFDQFNLSDNSLDSKIQKYHELNKLHYLLVVDLKKFSISGLSDMFSDISKTSVKPQKIILIRYRDSDMTFSYDKIETIIKQHNISYPWRIQTMLDNTTTYEEILHNITAINPKYRFIASLSAPTKISNIVHYANKLVHEDLDQFVVISNKDKTALLYSGAVYRFGLIQEKNNILSDDNNYITI